MSIQDTAHDHADADPPGTHDHGTDSETGTLRVAAVRRARILNRVTIGWNVVESVVALTAGAVAGSVSLIGFGLDAVVEVSAGLVLAWRLHQERRGGCMQESDQRATRLIAVSLAALAAYVAVSAVADIASAARPDASPVGIALAATSLVLMPVLARAKRRLAPVMGSRAVEAEASQTDICAWLSAVLLVGLSANALLGWWWADPLAALGIAGLAAAAAWRHWHADDLEDTCCA